MEENELLFFDTFANDVNLNEGPNLGLVQFPNPIIIEEIRVIPLGARVEADFPGGVRLGATNPSSFKIEFFINDLTKRDACTFLDIGSFEYKQNDNIQFIPKEKIPTDGLILRGMYSTLTLAVFGSVADISSIIAQESTPTSTPTIAEPSLSSNSPKYIGPEISEPTSFKDSDLERITEVCAIKTEELPLIETVEEIKKRVSPIEKVKKNVSRGSSLSSDGKKNDRKRKGSSVDRHLRDRKKRHYSRDRKRLSRSPISPCVRGRSRSRSISPVISRRDYYSRQRSPSSRSRSPRRRHRSPRKHRSRSVSPPYSSNRTLSSKSLSPSSDSVSRLRYKSPSNNSRSPPSQTHKLKPKSEDKKSDPIKQKTNFAFYDEELFEPLSPDHSLSDIAEKISDDDDFDQIINEADEGNTSSTKGDNFEEISSEEEYEDDGGMVEGDLLLDYADFEMGDYGYMELFNPFQCEFYPLRYLKDPSLTIYEINENDHIDSNEQSDNKIIQIINAIKTHEINEKWTEALEQLSIELPKTPINDPNILETLIDLVFDGLDFDKAMQQLTAFKVRHLKAGIKLLIAFFHTNESNIKLLFEKKLPQKLLYLYNKPHMTLPVRLLIIRAIDAISDSGIGTEHLIEHYYDWINENSEKSRHTCYQMLLNFLMEKPSTRIVIGITALLRKIHFFEALRYLCNNNSNSDGIVETSTDIDPIALCLTEVGNCYRNAPNVIGQPLRYLPALSQFDVKTMPPNHTYQAIYKYFKHYNFIQFISNILMGQTVVSSEVFDGVLELLYYMSNFHHGLTFLLTKDVVTHTNNLHKILIQQCDDNENHIQNIGMKLIYRLHVMQLLDSLRYYSVTPEHPKLSDTSKDICDYSELCSTLHDLYLMLFSGIGRDSIVNVLSMDHNFDLIISFISLSAEKEKDTHLFKSVCSGYAVELCLITLQFNDNNTIAFLENYGPTLLKLSESEFTPKLQLISQWLMPIKLGLNNLLSYTETSFKNIMAIIKRHADAATELNENGIFSISAELITAMRILQHLCVPSEYQMFDSEVQLKHNYAIIQVYSLNGLSHFLLLLSKLCDTYLRPSHQSVALVGNNGAFVIAFVKPTVLILKAILSYLVISLGSEFRDISLVPVLLRVNTVLALFPSSSMYLTFAQQIQYEITEILMIFTELYLTSPESDDSFGKSVWTKMIQQVVTYTMSSPLVFIHGLEILSDILPQPLPLSVKEPMTHDEIVKTINFRKLWSAHLHLLNDDIDKLMVNFSNSNITAIQLLLRRICVQLSDLSAPSAHTIAKCIYDILYDSIDSIKEGESLSRHTIRVLTFFIDISTHHPFKIALLNVLQLSIKKEEKHLPILSRILTFLSKSSKSNNTRECINNIIEPLKCESEGLLSIGADPNDTPDLLVNENLNSYFANRQVYVLHTDDERPNSFAFSLLSEDADHMNDNESIKIDLLELSERYFGPEFDISVALEKVCRIQEFTERQTIAKDNEETEKKYIKKYQPFISTGYKDSLAMNKRIGAPRGRGRSFMRGNDPFRSRPPNTSRPPSMHVDDFVMMEHHEPNPKRGVKDFTRSRGSSNNSMRSVGSAPRSYSLYPPSSGSYNDFRRSPSSNIRNGVDRYTSRDQLIGRSNRNDSNWSKVSGTRYDMRHVTYSRSLMR